MPSFTTSPQSEFRLAVGLLTSTAEPRNPSLTLPTVSSRGRRLAVRLTLLRMQPETHHASSARRGERGTDDCAVEVCDFLGTAQARSLPLRCLRGEGSFSLRRYRPSSGNQEVFLMIFEAVDPPPGMSAVCAPTAAPVGVSEDGKTPVCTSFCKAVLVNVTTRDAESSPVAVLTALSWETPTCGTRGRPRDERSDAVGAFNLPTFPIHPPDASLFSQQPRRQRRPVSRFAFSGAKRRGRYVSALSVGRSPENTQPLGLC